MSLKNVANTVSTLACYLLVSFAACILCFLLYLCCFDSLLLISFGAVILCCCDPVLLVSCAAVILC